MNYDAEKLAVDLVSKRRGRQGLTLRQTAEQICVSHMVVQKAETRKPISKTSLTKISAWLEKEPGEYFKNSEL